MTSRRYVNTLSVCLPGVRDLRSQNGTAVNGSRRNPNPNPTPSGGRDLRSQNRTPQAATPHPAPQVVTPLPPPVRDLRSQNGTAVNGSRLIRRAHGGQALVDGDVLCLGAAKGEHVSDAQYLVAYERSPTPSTPVRPR